MKHSWHTWTVATVAVACWSLGGCETNHPQEAPEVVEVDAATVAPPGPTAAGSLDGWWVKVCPHKTDAETFRISVGPDDHDITQKIIWRSGDPLEFQLLGGRDYNRIYLVGYSGQDGKTAYFAVCHNNQVCCKHYQPNQTEISGGEGHLVQNSDTEVWDCQ